MPALSLPTLGAAGAACAVAAVICVSLVFAALGVAGENDDAFTNIVTLYIATVWWPPIVYGGAAAFLFAVGAYAILPRAPKCMP